MNAAVAEFSSLYPAEDLESAFRTMQSQDVALLEFVHAKNQKALRRSSKSSTC